MVARQRLTPGPWPASIRPTQPDADPLVAVQTLTHHPGRAMTLRRLLAPTLLVLPLVGGGLACGVKDAGDTGGTSGDGGTTGDTGDTGDTQAQVVWQDLSFSTSSGVTGVYAASTDEVWVTLSAGKTMLYQAGAWNELSIDVSEEDLNGIWGSGSGTGATVVAVGDAGNIATWSGAGWVVDDVGTANFEAVDGAASTDLLAVGWGGLYANASGEWAYQDLPTDPRFNDVWYDGSAGAAVGEEGALARLVNGEWTIEEDPEGRTFYGVSGTGANDIYAVGEGGVILHWNGTEWDNVSTTTEQGLWGVWAANSNAIYVVGNAGTALVRDNGTWRSLETGVNTNLYAVHGTSVSDVWAVGGFGTALRYQP